MTLLDSCSHFSHLPNATSSRLNAKLMPIAHVSRALAPIPQGGWGLGHELVNLETWKLYPPELPAGVVPRLGPPDLAGSR